MSAPTGASNAPAAAHTAAEALSLLDALARAPAAAALVIAALERADRKALRLAHPQLRNAVGEATTKLKVLSPVPARPPTVYSAVPARPPTPRRWPRLEELTFSRGPDAAAFEALRSGTWRSLHTLRLGDFGGHSPALGAPAARALAAAAPRMPALRALVLYRMKICDAAAAELFRAASAVAPLQLRALTLVAAELPLAAARALAATGWRLEELDLFESTVGAASLAALVAAPTFAIRRLGLRSCGMDAAALLSLASAPWPLEELDLSCNDLRAAAVGPALEALSRHTRLRLRWLNIDLCSLSAAGFKALVEATWPALNHLSARAAQVALEGPDALGAAAFADFPALEELHLSLVELGEAGARPLASRRWPHLRVLSLHHALLGDAGLAAFVRGEFPAL